MCFKRNINVIKITPLIKLFIIVLLFFGTSNGYLHAQSQNRKGVYLGGQKGWNIFKSRKKYSHIKKRKSRNKLSKRNNNYRKRSAFKRSKLKRFNKKHSSHKRNGKVKLKNTKLGKKGSLYSYSKKKKGKIKGRKGRFPKSKKELGNKLTVHLSTGIITTQGNENLDSNDEIIDVYSNYRPSAHLTAGALYNHNNKVSIGFDAKIFRLKSKDEENLETDDLGLKLNTAAIGLHIKYNILPSSNKFSPYISFGPTFSFTKIVKLEDDNNEIEATNDRDEIIVTRILSPSYSTPTIPLYGIKLAIGTDFKLNNKISGFIQADLDFSSAKNTRKIKEYFSKNESDFIFYGLNFGIRYNLFQKTSLY